jgi:hypothetical protein
MRVPAATAEPLEEGACCRPLHLGGLPAAVVIDSAFKCVRSPAPMRTWNALVRQLMTLAVSMSHKRNREGLLAGITRDVQRLVLDQHSSGSGMDKCLPLASMTACCLQYRPAPE